MLLLKNQPLSSCLHEKEVGKLSTNGREPTKTYNQPNGGHLSLKDEISMLSMTYRNRMGVQESDIEKAAALYRTSASEYIIYFNATCFYCL